jgi:hypothetical protein
MAKLKKAVWEFTELGFIMILEELKHAGKYESNT